MSKSVNLGYNTLKSTLSTNSVMRLGILEDWSRTTSKRLIMFGPPERFCNILISLFIFFFFTGLRTLITRGVSEMMSIPSNT